MNRNVWLSESFADVNEKIRYWVDKWEELLDNFNLNSYGLKLSSPHVLIDAIADEIQHNDLRNENTRRVFKTELSRTLKHDSVITGSLRVEFVALVKNLDGSQLLYLHTVCGTIRPFFAGGDYFRLSLAALRSILENDTWQDSDSAEIGRLSNILIVELLLHNYSLKTIRRMPEALFSELTEMPDGYPLTDFPHNIDWRHFEQDNKVNVEAYRAAIQPLVQGLTVSQRVSALSGFYDRPLRAGIDFPRIWRSRFV